MNTNDPVIEAHKRAKAKLGFYSHLAVYIAVNSVIILINFSTSPGYFWAIWPLMGWGVGLAVHAFFTYFLAPGNKILDQMTEAELRKGKTRQH